ncbi:hypothetical protein D3C78_1137990 [compost metagenome]
MINLAALNGAFHCGRGIGISPKGDHTVAEDSADPLPYLQRIRRGAAAIHTTHDIQHLGSCYLTHRQPTNHRIDVALESAPDLVAVLFRTLRQALLNPLFRDRLEGVPVLSHLPGLFGLPDVRWVSPSLDVVAGGITLGTRLGQADTGIGTDGVDVFLARDPVAISP